MQDDVVEEEVAENNRIIKHASCQKWIYQVPVDY